MPEPIIVDISSLIALERIDLLPILCKIYKEVVIPESVIIVDNIAHRFVATTTLAV